MSHSNILASLIYVFLFFSLIRTNVFILNVLMNLDIALSMKMSRCFKSTKEQATWALHCPAKLHKPDESKLRKNREGNTLLVAYLCQNLLKTVNKHCLQMYFWRILEEIQHLYIYIVRRFYWFHLQAWLSWKTAESLLGRDSMVSWAAERSAWMCWEI